MAIQTQFEASPDPAARRALFDLKRQISDLQTAVDALGSSSATAWTAVTFAGAWADNGGSDQPAEYRKVDDIVYLRGVIKNGTTATTAFTLPTGFRPPADFFVPIAQNPSSPLLGTMSISSAGVCTPRSIYSFSTYPAGFSIQFSIT